MNTYAKVILDSVNSYGDRLTTLELQFPRFILAQFNTHRQFSRNAASSRAIPTAKLIEQVEQYPVIPVRFGLAQKGMVAGVLDAKSEEEAGYLWMIARDDVLRQAEWMMRYNVAKEIVNRLLEPWMWTKVLVSATTYENFLKLRLGHDVQPDMQRLAECMRDALAGSVPVRRKWHVPFIGEDECSLPPASHRKLSVARCARVSYLNHEGQRDHSKDYALHDQLAGNGHLSPFEHVAHEMPTGSGNFTGWRQYRYYIEHNYEPLHFDTEA